MISALIQSICGAITSSSRPVWTLLFVQVSLMVLYWASWETRPDIVIFLLSPMLLGLVAFFSLIEFWAQHDESVSEMTRSLKIDQITGAFVTFIVSMVVTIVNESADPIAGNGLSGGFLATASGQTFTPAMALNAAIAVSINLILGHYRAQLHEYLEGFELKKTWQWFESGGILVALILLLFSPILTLSLLVVFLGMVSLTGVMLRGVSLLVDQMERVPCKKCGEKIRQEASLCIHCGHTQEPALLLENPKKDWTFASLWRLWTKKDPVLV
ncbi:MAG: zinc ribbon domain-containing protein [Myxococcota bacterium]|nr:zinc ribbon domain-containing protein [Myxococcota bacterium]